MKLATLIEDDLIPPGQSSPADDLDSVEDNRQMEVYRLENEVAQYYFRVYQKAGIELFDDEGIPVNVNFDSERKIVEVEVTTDDSFSMQALIRLSEVGAIGPNTVIRPLRDGKLDLTTEFPAEDTPFKQFLSDTASVETASNSGSVGR